MEDQEKKEREREKGREWKIGVRKRRAGKEKNGSVKKRGEELLKKE